MASERAKNLTSFRGPSGGLFRYRYMPFGLVNAMAVWSRFIDDVLSQYRFQFVLCYADDVLIYTKKEKVDEHIRDLTLVFDLLEKAGIKIKASKLKIGLKFLPFLGVVFSENGMTPNREKTKAIEELPFPTNLKQLRKLSAFSRTTGSSFKILAKSLHLCTLR